MSFLKLLNKSFFFASLLLLSSTQSAHAYNKLYRYDGNTPFVQMMLSMMSAMGILDRMPANGTYGRYGNAFSPWSTYGNPYSQALGWQGLGYGLPNGLTPGLSSGVVDNPFIRSPWIGSPWTQSAVAGVSPLWGSPDWGVLPVDSYSYNRYAPYGSPWSVDDISGWVDEPWETSDWNPNASLAQSKNRGTAQDVKPQAGNAQSSQLSQPIVPIVQNFSYNVPADASPNQSRDEHRNQPSSHRSSPQQPPRRQPPRQQPQQRQSAQHSSPLAKLRYPGSDRSSLTRNPQLRNAQAPDTHARNTQARDTQGYGAQMRNRDSRSAADWQGSQYKPSGQFSKKQHYEKPCITDFCGLKKPYLDGLWLAQDGEMLGIKNKRYLWSDGKKRYLTGRLKIENEYLVADVDGHERLMRFKYKLAGDHLLTMQPDGVVREFVRMPGNRRTPGYGNAYVPGQNAVQNYGAYYR